MRHPNRLAGIPAALLVSSLAVAQDNALQFDGSDDRVQAALPTIFDNPAANSFLVLAVAEQNSSQCFDCEWRSRSMNHRVTIRTDWSKVFDRIYFSNSVGQWPKVVNMDEAFT